MSKAMAQQLAMSRRERKLSLQQDVRNNYYPIQFFFFFFPELILIDMQGWSSEEETPERKKHTQSIGKSIYKTIGLSSPFTSISPSICTPSTFWVLPIQYNICLFWLAIFFSFFFQTSELLAEVALLEEEVARLEEQVVCFRQKLLICQEETTPTAKKKKKKKIV